jgi:Tol biopolymer transport system component
MHSPTLSVHATMQGVILGTAAYMAPEQARAKAVDRRADIWAFGVVLYEMLTGTRAFRGDDMSDVLAAVLRQDIAWAALPAHTPPRVRRLLERCLDRDVKARLRDIGEARVEISRIQSGVVDAAEPTRPAPADASGLRRWERAAWAAAVALVAAALVWRSLEPHQEATRDRPIRFQISAPANVTFDFLDENAGAPAISPDGGHVVFVAGAADGISRLSLRSLDGLAIRDLPNTEGAQNPFWSFDSRSVGFYADGKLKTIDVGGGAPHTVCDLGNLRGGLRGGTWNANGVILFSTGAFGLYRVPAAGGTPSAVTTLDRARDENSHRWPAFLPDGQHFVYFVRTSHPETTGISVGTLASRQGQFLVAAESGPEYAAPGYLLFVRHGALLGQPFDARALRVTGDPFTVVEQVALGGITRRGMFTVSDTGVLAYWNGANLPRALTWFGRNGERIRTIGDPLAYRNPAISPDGSRVAVEIFDAATGATDIWLVNAVTGVPTRFTFERGHRRYPVWSPDGSRIIYQSDHEGSPAFYEKASSGAGIESVVLKPTGAVIITPIDWSPGTDASLIYQINDPLHDADIWMLPFKTHTPVPVVRGPFDQSHPRVSLDGRWMAYASNESGRQEVYVQAFPGPGGTVQVSTTGGSEPQWRRDGRELYYLGADRHIMAAPVQGTLDRFSAGVPTALFAAPLGALDLFARNYFAPAADGQQFLVNGLATNVVTAPITVVTNWLADVKR